MTAITYIAKRRLVPGPFTATGTDISADGTLDQFGSTTTDLSGLVINDNILVAGFANADNNGWHIVSGTSSATVLPTAASALVTEAAGPTINIQQYMHLFGSSYQLEVGPAELNPWELPKSSESISQGGLEQSILHRIEEGYTFKSGKILDEDMPYWREFLQSVMAKEPFVFDGMGSIATPDDPIAVTLQGAPTWSRLSNIGWQVSFKLRKL